MWGTRAEKQPTGGAGGKESSESPLFLRRPWYSKIIASKTVSMLLSPGGVTSASHGKFPEQKNAILLASSKMQKQSQMRGAHAIRGET